MSGQIPRDPVTGELAGDDIESQTRQVIRNVERALAAAGATLSDVVSVIVYLADANDWGAFNTAYKELMPQPFPTRTALGAQLRGILVEVSDAEGHRPARSAPQEREHERPVDVVADPEGGLQNVIVFISDVTPGSPAEAAGLHGAD